MSRTDQSRAPAPVVVCSILERDAERTRRRLREAPDACGLVEIRGDHLRGEDLAELVRGAGRELIVTIRRRQDGGHHDGSEEERRRALEGALEAGARFVDVEDDGPLLDLADGPHAQRVVLSHHGGRCSVGPLESRFRAMAARRAARLKIVPRADRVAELAAVRELLARATAEGRALACFALGRAGAVSRLFAPSWGSWATYGAAAPGRATAPGQFTVDDLLETYDVLRLSASTRRFGLIGEAVFGSPSPAMHAAGYREVGLDACYVPIELERLDELEPLLGAHGLLGLEAVGVTIPFKEPAAARCRQTDPVGQLSGAVNTLVFESAGWSGYNTDGPAILALVREHEDPAGARAAVVGAGGTARAAAAVLRGAGAQVTLYNRSPARAQRVGRALGVAARPLSELAEARWDLLVQATPLGRRGERLLAAERLCGRTVLDAVYGARTPLVVDARSRGLGAVDGYALLAAQALLQFERMTGLRPAARTLADAGRRWLTERGLWPGDAA